MKDFGAGPVTGCSRAESGARCVVTAGDPLQSGGFQRCQARTAAQRRCVRASAHRHGRRRAAAGPGCSRAGATPAASLCGPTWPAARPGRPGGPRGAVGRVLGEGDFDRPAPAPVLAVLGRARGGVDRRVEPPALLRRQAAPVGDHHRQQRGVGASIAQASSVSSLPNQGARGVSRFSQRPGRRPSSRSRAVELPPPPAPQSAPSGRPSTRAFGWSVTCPPQQPHPPPGSARRSSRSSSACIFTTKW